MKELEYFSTRLPEELKTFIKVKAAKDKTKVQDLVAKVFQELMDKEKDKEGE